MASNGYELQAKADMVQPKKARNLNATKHGLYGHVKDAPALRERAVRHTVNKAYNAAPWLTTTELPTERSWAESTKLKT